MKKSEIIGVILIAGLISCGQKKSENTNQTEAKVDSVVVEAFPPLKAGNIFLKDADPFGEVTELKGTQLTHDTVIFKPNEPQMLIDGDLFLMRNGFIGEAPGPLMVFSYPDLTFSHYVGRFGKGADEFILPVIVQATKPSVDAYLFEMTNNKLYEFTNKNTLSLSPFVFPKGKSTGMFSTKEFFTEISPNEFIYTDNSKTGKSIFRAYLENDTVKEEEIYNLALNPKRKGWANYIGSLAVNKEKKRMVYAYKYFKLLKFIDMETGETRTLDFEKEEFDESTVYQVDGLDNNTTHYWQICAQKDYVYCLYSGRKPQVAYQENSKGIHYIYVEQFDWNGNPIRKFKLDRWGYFHVDEARHKLILLSTYDDDPFFLYTF